MTHVYVYFPYDKLKPKKVFASERNFHDYFGHYALSLCHYNNENDCSYFVHENGSKISGTIESCKVI